MFIDRIYKDDLLRDRPYIGQYSGQVGGMKKVPEQSQATIMPVETHPMMNVIGSGLTVAGNGLKLAGDGLTIPGNGLKLAGDGIARPIVGAGHAQDCDEDEDDYLTCSERLTLSMAKEAAMGKKKGKKKGKKVAGSGLKLAGNGVLTMSGGGVLSKVNAMNTLEKALQQLGNDFGLSGLSNVDIKNVLKSAKKDVDLAGKLSRGVSKSLIEGLHKKYKQSMKGNGKAVQKVHDEWSKALQKDIQDILTHTMTGSGIFKSIWKGVKKIGKKGVKWISKNWKGVAKKAILASLNYGIPVAAGILAGPEAVAPAKLATGALTGIANSLIKV